jgi:DNA-binding transcriptional regulator GbsR (MarR family)
MDIESRIKKQKELVEVIGRFYDQEGFQPIAGRILGLLMVMDKEQFTFDEIVEELQISKSSASNALKNLEIRGNIEYVTKPGDRKRYFQVKKMEPFSLIDDFEEKLNQSKWFLEKVLELKSDPHSPNSNFFRSLIEMIDFFFMHLDHIKEEFKKKK